MTELHEIFADTAPATVFFYASAACLILCVMAALWLRHNSALRSRARKLQ